MSTETPHAKDPQPSSSSSSMPARSLTPQEECELFCPNPSGKLQRLCEKVLTPGDHIWVRLPGGTIAHHGIYCEGGTVIHYCSDGRKKSYDATMAVRETCWHIFTSQRRDVTVEVVPYAESFEHAHSLAIARSRIGHANYSLLGNNCEHLSSYCRVGVCQSHQVRAVAESSSGVIAVGASATAGGVVAAAAGSYEVPVVLGSQGLGYWTQSVLANTALGNILGSSGLVTTKLVVVPAASSVLCLGVGLGAAVGCLGYGAYHIISRTYTDGSKMVCVSHMRRPLDHLKDDITTVDDIRELPFHGPLTVPYAVTTPSELVDFLFKATALPDKDRLLSVVYVSCADDAGHMYVRVTDVDALPSACSLLLVLPDEQSNPTAVPANPTPHPEASEKKGEPTDGK